MNHTAYFTPTEYQTLIDHVGPHHMFDKALIALIRGHDKKLFGQLLDRGLPYDYHIDWLQGASLLHALVQYNKFNLIKHLCDHATNHGIALDFNTQTQHHESPLIMAVQKSKYKMTKTLLECGASPNFRNYHGDSAASLGAFSKSPSQFLDLFLSHPLNEQTVHANSETYGTLLGNYMRREQKDNSSTYPMSQKIIHSFSSEQDLRLFSSTLEQEREFNPDHTFGCQIVSQCIETHRQKLFIDKSIPFSQPLLSQGSKASFKI